MYLCFHAYTCAQAKDTFLIALILTLNDARARARVCVCVCFVALAYDEKDTYDGGIVTAYEHTA